MKMERLRHLRREQNLSQVEMAKIFNVHQSAVCQWEGGRANPDFEKLKKIAEYFGVTVDYLLETDTQGTKKAPTDDKGSMSNFDFALFDELSHLNETQKEDVLNFARFIRQKNNGCD